VVKDVELRGVWPDSRAGGTGISMTALSVVVGGEALLSHPRATGQGRFRLAGRELVSALAEARHPSFDTEDDHNRDRVLVEVSAFSCNYRDRGILLQADLDAPNRVTPVGSEFCARVLQVGRDVSTLRSGDRVFANNQWPRAVADGVRAGIPTDHASRRHHCLHSRQLVRVPKTMSDEEAAAFALGAQTAYGMVRRLHLSFRDPVLVTAAASSTSQFTISALHNHPTRPHILALTTSAGAADSARRRGADEAVVIPRATLETLGAAPEQLSTLVADAGGFAAIIDPFQDVYFPVLAGLLRDEGRYISCGLAAQYQGADLRVVPDGALARALAQLSLQNATFIGHCLGTGEDLERALRDYLDGRLPVPLDSVHTGPPAPFLQRSFIDRHRVGKVVYRY